MKKNNAPLATLSCLILLGLLLAACAPAATPGPSTVDEETGVASEPTAAPPAVSEKPASITVAVQAGAPEVAVYKPRAAAWEQQSGIKIEWVEIPQENQHDKLLTEFSSRTGAYDVIGLDQPWVAEFAAAGYLEPLDDRMTEADKDDFFAGFLDLMTYNGKLFGVPHYMFAPIMYYRTDLFEKYGVRVPTLDEPMTKEEFLDAAQKITTGEGDDVFGTIVEAKRHVVPVAHFGEYVAREGGELVDGSRIPHVNEEPAVAALQFMTDLVNLYQVAPPGALGFDHVDNHTLFMNGKLGMVINWPYAFSLISDPAQSQVYDKFSVTIPWMADRSTTAVGGWALAMAADSAKKDAAWDFITYMTSTDELYALRKGNFGPPSRQSELDELLAASRELLPEAMFS